MEDGAKQAQKLLANHSQPACTAKEAGHLLSGQSGITAEK